MANKSETLVREDTTGIVNDDRVNGSGYLKQYPRFNVMQIGRKIGLFYHGNYDTILLNTFINLEDAIEYAKVLNFNIVPKE